MNITKKTAALFSGIGLLGGALGAAALQTYAQTSTSNMPQQPNFTPPAAMGEVTGVSGNTITITDQKTGKSYSVDASSATIKKQVISTVTASDIKTGDKLAVQGTLNGTNITATEIMAGQLGGRGFGPGHGMMGKQLAAVGTVTAINGTTLTITDAKSSTTFSVEASAATFVKAPTFPTNGTKPTTPPTPTQISLSDIKVGDVVGVQGTTSGTTITATKVIDGIQTKPHGFGGRFGHQSAN